MKTIKIIFVGLVLAFGLFSCTKDFVEINTNPNAILPEEASARYFITNPQYQLYAPDRYPYWRAHLIHVDRYAGHFTFGHHGSWWNDELGYKYSSSYTDAAWGWMEGYLGGLDNFMKLTGVEGDFENPLMYAVGQIMKGMYYQMFTDIFGEIPYSEAANPDIDLPKFDTQIEIYTGIIADLDAAMATIGDNLITGGGVEDLGNNDLYCGGDLQKWKKLANTLKLRIATRALGATGDNFASAAISAALANPLLEAGDDILLSKDNEISQWSAAAYSDVWYRFGGLGSKWSVGQVMINYMLKNNDPRLPEYAKLADGGTFTFIRPDATDNPDGHANFEKRTRFIAHAINQAIIIQGGDTSAVYAFVGDTSAIFTVPENLYYIGQPTRLNSKIKSYARAEFWSDPAEPIIQFKNEGKPIREELIMSAAESYFLQAQAAENASAGSGQTLYESGITEAMKLWGVDEGDITTYISSGAPLTNVSLENIAIQRWMACYTDGFEAWSIVRKSGFPVELAAGVSDVDIFGLGDAGLNGLYPMRMKYGNNAYNTNGDNLQTALGRQGVDEQGISLWWAK